MRHADVDHFFPLFLGCLAEFLTALKEFRFVFQWSFLNSSSFLGLANDRFNILSASYLL